MLVEVLPWKNLQKLRNIIDIMHNTSIEIFDEKKKALEKGDEAVSNQVGRGKDILSILSRQRIFFMVWMLIVAAIVKANMDANDEDRLPEKEVLGQVSTPRCNFP